MEQRPQFDASFLVGIEQVDQEHQRLFEIAGRVFDVLTGAAVTPDATALAIADLLDYTETHFVSEEALMAAAGYPDLAEHRQLHRQLLVKARDMEIRAVSGESYLPVELNQFLASWLIDHIQTADRRFGEFVAAGLKH